MDLHRPTPDPTGPGQESVWDYPRPPRVEPTSAELKIVLGGRVIAWTTRGLRVLETSHPPVFFFPPGDVDAAVIRPSDHAASLCEYKGLCEYLDLYVSNDDREVSAPAAAFTYVQPTPNYALLAGHIAFYAGAMDACSVDGVQVTPQPGGFYAGWITPSVTGPFKGLNGTMGW